MFVPESTWFRGSRAWRGVYLVDRDFVESGVVVWYLGRQQAGVTDEGEPQREPERHHGHPDPGSRVPAHR